MRSRTQVWLWAIGLTLLASHSTAVKAGGVFWSDRGASSLVVMGFHGESRRSIQLTGSVETPGRNVRGLAVDNQSEWLFWADNGSDRILRCRWDGSESAVLHAIEGGNSFPADLYWDFARQSLYWCDRQRRHIQAYSLAGGSPVTLISDAAVSGPYFMDWEAEAEKLYWGEFAGGSIYRANRDGSERELLITGNREVRGVKVDSREGMLYWVDRNQGVIYRTPLSGLASGARAVSHEAVEALYTGLDTPHGLELDLPARKLYWADTGTNAGAGRGQNAINRGDLDGTGPQEILATGAQPWDVVLDRRCGSYAEWSRRVFRRDESPARIAAMADPDGDGLMNALEYAFDRCPLFVEAEPPVQGLRLPGNPGEGPAHGIQFEFRSDAADLQFDVQASLRADVWDESTRPTGDLVAMPPVLMGDGMARGTVSTRYAVDTLAEHYLRLTITLAGEAHSLMFSLPAGDPVAP